METIITHRFKVGDDVHVAYRGNYYKGLIIKSSVELTYSPSVQHTIIATSRQGQTLTNPILIEAYEEGPFPMKSAE